MRFPTQTIGRLQELLRPPPPDPAQQLFRLKAVERDVILPIKAVYIGFLVYYFLLTPWYGETLTALQIAQTMTEKFCGIYIAVNVAVAIFLLKSRRLSLVWGQRVVFVMSVVDSLFLAALTLVTNGFDSVLYWLFPGLIIRNALIFPIARVQIVLNVTIILSFLVAGTLDVILTNNDIAESDPAMRRLYDLPDEVRTEPFLLRLTVLVFLMASCYGLQVLFEKSRLAAEESREFAARQEQLRAAGRLAAELRKVDERSGDPAPALRGGHARSGTAVVGA